MISIHLDTLKWAAMWILLAFALWNWAVAENEIRHLVSVGESLGAGWNECMTSLEPRLEEIETTASYYIGLGLEVDP
jgi:hypothetical protein